MNSQKLLVLVLKLEVSHRSHTISSSQTHRGYRLWIVVSYAATCSAQCDLSQRDNKFSVLHNVPTLTLTCNSLLFDSLRECPINIDSLLIDTVLYFPRLTSNRYSLTWPTVRNSNTTTSISFLSGEGESEREAPKASENGTRQTTG